MTERQRLESEISKLEHEYQQFQERIVETAAQRRTLQKSLANEKKVRAVAISDMVDFEALNDNQTAKGFIDKILQAKADGGTTHQLQLNIDKLVASEQHCRKRQSEVSKQINGLKKQIRKLDESEALMACYESYNVWYESVLANEDKWFAFKESVKRCHYFQLDYGTALRENGITDEVFFDVMQSRLRPGVLAFRKQAELIRELSTITQVRPNRWYLEPGKLNERHGKPKKLIDRRRANFKD